LKAAEQPIDTSTAAGKCFLDMLGVFAEFETNLRRERQLEGIARAKAAGVYKGRMASIDAARVREMKAQGPWAPRRWASAGRASTGCSTRAIDVTGETDRAIYQLLNDGLLDSCARTRMPTMRRPGGRRDIMFTGLLAVLIVGTLAGSVEADRGDGRYRTPDYPRYSRDYYDGYGSGYGAYGGCGGYRGYACCGGYDGCRGYGRCGGYGGYGW